jgi:membrane associated rhomboid family serine protease
MTPTPVGMRCPECARDRTRVRTLRPPSVPTRSVTDILIGLNIVAFLAELATGVTLGGTDKGWVYEHGALAGPLLTGGHHEYWRLLTSGFLHAGLVHIALNMLSLWFVGRALEPVIGPRNFLAVYLASLLAGSFGALLFEPDVPTLGASTAIFGVLGALIVVAHSRRISIWQSGLGFWLLLNLMWTFTQSDISVGGHLGGLVGGLITGWLVTEYAERRGRPQVAQAGCLFVAAASVAAAIAVAGGTGLTPHGTTF